MLTDPKLRSQVDALWDKFWTGGLSNPLDAIEQFSYLLFFKRLDDRENAAERQAKRKGATYQPSVKKEMRWGYCTKLKAEEALSHLKQVVFLGLVELADAKSPLGEYMKTVEIELCGFPSDTSPKSDMRIMADKFMLTVGFGGGRRGSGVVARALH